ncbi:MAG: hypothetical protein ACLTTH_02760 [Holdemanella porci]
MMIIIKFHGAPKIAKEIQKGKAKKYHKGTVGVYMTRNGVSEPVTLKPYVKTTFDSDFSTKTA